MCAENVIDIAVFMLGLSAAELTANWAQWWWWRFHEAARLAASFGGLLVFLFNRFVLFPALGPPGPDTPYLLVLASIGMTTALWAVVALLTRSEPMGVFVSFYRRARPPGWWGPVAGASGLEPRGAWPIAAGLVAAAVGTVMTGAGVIALSCAYLGRWHPAGIAALIAVAAGAVFRPAFARVTRAHGAEPAPVEPPE